MGHSMGGGLVLAFPTRIYTPPSKETVAMLSGVISSSPLIHQTFPASKALRFLGGKAGAWLPYMTISAPVAIEDLSHDPAANEANAKDPLIIQKGSLRGLDDMLSGGEKLLQKDFQHWPKKLPLLLVHGTGDRITSPKASEEFIHKIDAEDKQLSLYPDGFHELVQEPNGVKEKYVDECISWVLAHLPQSEAVVNSRDFPLNTIYTSAPTALFFTAFAAQYPAYGFDLDMMKRPMDTVGGPDAKKASITQNGFNNSPPSSGFAGNPSTLPPSLSINTATAGNGMPSQMSPNTAGPYTPQQQQPSASPNGNLPYGFGGYNMLGMGLPAMGVLGGFPYNGQMANFAQQLTQQRLPSLAIPGPQASPYSPATLTAALSAQNNLTGRTVYVGNLPATASVDELLNLVHFGPLESIRVLPEKSCVFLSFLDGATAAAFHADALIKKLSLHGQELKIGWGKPSPVPSQVALAIQQSNASRNVYLGGLDENVTEEQLRDDLSRFGLIDQVKIVRDKNIGFVHFLSISTATKVVNTLPTEPRGRSQQAAAQAAQAAAAQSLVAQSAVLSPLQTNQGFTSPLTPYMPFSPDALQSLAAGQGLNRTVYLGNIHPETTTEDLCNAIRGGVLQSLRYMQDKHIAFVTFIDPAAALTFFQVASYQGLTLNNRRFKIGWGKNSGPLPPALALAVHSGATRNVYVGNIEDFDTFTEDKLKRDFGEYGDIELVNFLREKNCAFVNFTNISNAIKAIDGVKNKPDYANLRIAHGKDRCANPPRSGPQGGSGMRRSASGNGASSGGPSSAVEPKTESEDSDGLLLGDEVKEEPLDITEVPVGEVAAAENIVSPA
ncbi:Negative regulator of differentiation 1 [Grifola frondosa]|uniref:Negative regulator of differentiation 1 n=1 Tax=Grifola frondosa TaxID=5627 RepID=A0A1C7LYQ6_GRIFR|nr:Negative regulator of differentiation 1 [Grifola frondosa]